MTCLDAEMGGPFVIWLGTRVGSDPLLGFSGGGPGRQARHPLRGMVDIENLEARRRKAARLLGSGMTQAQVARLSGVARQTVNGWAQALKQDGLRGLRVPRLGRKPRLDESEFHDLVRLLRKGPSASGFDEGPWTVRRVALLIEQRFGVSYQRTRIVELLHEAGLVPRRRGWIRGEAVRCSEPEIK